MNYDKILRLSWKNFGFVVLAFVISVILHNAIYAIFNLEEAFFFVIAVIIIPLFFIISAIYTIIERLK